MNKKNVFMGFYWRLLERWGAQGVTFIVSIILARLLDPRIYGTIAIVNVFTSILQVFVDSGMGNALIQKKQIDDLDYSSIFCFNIFVCLLLYIIIFTCAPYIASFFEMPELTSVTRVLGITIIISGVKNIQQAYVFRNMLFKTFFFAALAGTLSAAAIGVFMAYHGYGIWALVAQNLLNQTMDTLILWLVVKWKPKIAFSFSRFKVLFSYGWKLLASNLINTLYSELRQLIIGKLYSSGDLAYYNQGEQFPRLIASNINTSIDSVLLPAMSKEQERVVHVKEMTRRAIKTSTFIIMPMMVGFLICSENIISIFLTDKWLPCIPFLKIFCIYYMFLPIHTANLNAIKALGHSGVFLKLEVIKKIIDVLILSISVWLGVKAIAYGMLLSTIICQVVNAWPNRKLLNYKYKEQCRDVLPQMILSIIMGIVVYFIIFLNLDEVVTVCIQIPLGIIVYFGLAWFFKVDSFYYILSIGKDLLFKK